jgi:HAD superfamily hydrolase (TIGR01458 family)
MSGEGVLVPQLGGVAGLVFDLEGTLYVGDRPVVGAAALIATLRARGLPMRFLTNTTTCAHHALTVKLRRMGFDVLDEEVFCAPTAAGRYLRENDASAWLLVSPEALPDFEGVRLDPDNPDYVVVGDLGDDWTFELLNRAFVLVRERRARLIGLVRSRYWLSPDGARLDVGPFVVALEYATGSTAKIFGKPERAIFETVLGTMALPAGSVAMVGDDPVTDAAAAAVIGMRTVLVRTGKYREGAEDPSESISADPCRADLVVDSVVDLIDSA